MAEADKQLQQSTSHEVSSQESPSAKNETRDAHGLINASGHVQELNRNFSLLSLAGVGLSVGNVWPAIGGSILTAIFNGGPPGQFISTCLNAPDGLH
jgi:choline transport protein